MPGKTFRLIAAIVSSALAINFFASDRELNLPNTLMSLAALISIAAVVMPPILRRNAHVADGPKATPRRSA